MNPSISSPDDLITSHAAVCEGFLLQAIEKSQRVEPFIEEARKFWQTLKSVATIPNLLRNQEIQEDLLSAAGFSQKAQNHLSQNELLSALKKVLETLKNEGKEDWRQELFYRYLLTKGDSLGGSMRNITGAQAGTRFSNSVCTALVKKNIQHEVFRSTKDKIQAIQWDNRLLLFDRTPNFIGKNIDVIFLNSLIKDLPFSDRLDRKSDYIACGELKGGIDPAGADEHWKTANSALQRIRNAFVGQCIPALFFVGAAIEPAMAKEIFNQLTDGRLSQAANFTIESQLNQLVEWLISL